MVQAPSELSLVSHSFPLPTQIHYWAARSACHDKNSLGVGVPFRSSPCPPDTLPVKGCTYLAPMAGQCRAIPAMAKIPGVGCNQCAWDWCPAHPTPPSYADTYHTGVLAND